MYEKRAVTPYNTCQRRPRTRKNVLFCLVAACFSPGRTRMKSWFRGNGARSSCRQVHIRALEARVLDSSVRLCLQLSVICCVNAKGNHICRLAKGCCGLHIRRCLCPCQSAVMAMHLHCDQARPAWWAFLLHRKKVCAPKGGSNPCNHIPIDRAALSREFPRN